MVCAKTGIPTKIVLTHELYESPALSWLLYIFGPLGFVVQLLSSSHHSVRVPIAPAVLRRYRIVNWITASAVAVTLVAAVFPPFFLFLLGAVVTRTMLLRQVWVRVRVRDNQVLVTGCHPDFVAAATTLRPRPPAPPADALHP